MEEVKKWDYSGPGFLSLLTLMFIFLKLTGYISWSWFWVLSPILISLILVLVVVVGIVMYLVLKTIANLLIGV